MKSQCFSLGAAAIGGYRVSWDRLTGTCVALSPDSNGDFQTSAASPLYLSTLVIGIKHGIALLLSEKMFLSLQFSELHIICSVAPHSLLYLLGPAASSGRARGGMAWLHGFVFLLGNGSYQTTIVTPLYSISTPFTVQPQQIATTLAGTLTVPFCFSGLRERG